MFFFKRWWRSRKYRPKDYDFLPLFFWDQGLSTTAKIIMCIAGGGSENRDKTLNRLKETFPEDAVNSISEALRQLEQYGYLTSEQYRGEYGETRVDKRLCICPATRLPKLVQPTGSPLYPCTKAVEMYDIARDLGFIAESGMSTTYLLYDALRIFTAVENALVPGESVILPLIGLESMRSETNPAELSAYPNAVAAVVITSCRVIFVQEDSNVEGRQSGLGRILFKNFFDLQSVSLDEHCSRVTFVANPRDPRVDRIVIDLLSTFALDRFPGYYAQMLSLLPPFSRMPPLSYFHESYCP